MGKRYCAFYVIGCLALAFGGVLAYGLMQMDGLSGMRGWRWIFIMEGVVSSLPVPSKSAMTLTLAVLPQVYLRDLLLCLFLPGRLSRQGGSILAFLEQRRT